MHLRLCMSTYKLPRLPQSVCAVRTRHHRTHRAHARAAFRGSSQRAGASHEQVLLRSCAQSPSSAHRIRHYVCRCCAAHIRHAVRNQLRAPWRVRRVIHIARDSGYQGVRGGKPVRQVSAGFLLYHCTVTQSVTVPSLRLTRWYAKTKTPPYIVHKIACTTFMSEVCAAYMTAHFVTCPRGYPCWCTDTGGSWTQTPTSTSLRYTPSSWSPAW